MTTPADEPTAHGLLISSPIEIQEEWIDYNDHLNMAFYNVIFDRAFDEALATVGLGPEDVKATGFSYVALEAHICYLREVFRTDPVRVFIRVLDVDAKRVHLYSEMRHATDDWVAATSEWMFLCVDLAARRAAPWLAQPLTRLEALKSAADAQPWPARAGRRIGIPRKA